MINLEHKLTVNDLIIEYMIAKVSNGYEPKFLTSEFISFLYYFEGEMDVIDANHDNEELFKKFFELKNKNDWSIIVNWSTYDKIATPHMDMQYSEEDDDYLISANYRLSSYDKSVITTYFMNKQEVEKIRRMINKYLESQDKRKINKDVVLSEDEINVGKYVTAELINNIWNYYIGDLVNKHKWPKQCSDINKYLLDFDLAEVIGLNSIKNKLLEFYREISSRLAYMYHEDKNLKINMSSTSFLAFANYKLLIEGYEDIFSIAFSKYKSNFEIDLSSLTFTERHELDGFYDYDEDPDIKTTKKDISNNKIKELVKILDTSFDNK